MNPASPTLEGPRVLLRGPEAADVEHLVRWSNDPEIRQLTAEPDPLSREGAIAFLDTVQKDEDRVWYIILDKEKDKPIGECGLLRIFRPWGAADLTMILGEREYWGKGFSDEAMDLLLDLAFCRLGLHRVSVGVVEFNGRAINFYKRFGFREEGRRREEYLSGGRYHDFVMMSLLEHEHRRRLGAGGNG